MVAANLPPYEGHPGLHCNETTLLSLLDDTLTDQQQSLAEDHLSGCPSCRRRLETLVGDDVWWGETRSVYAEDESDHEARGSDFYELASAKLPGEDPTLTWLKAIAQPPRPDDPPCLGRVDRYRIDSVVGSGGMGVVVAAHDGQLGRPVAIKFLAPHLAGVAPARRRFTREARAVAAIVHPAIMPIYGVNEQSHPPYLVMPLIGTVSSKGRSLQDQMDDQGPLDLETALGIAAQVAEGLAAAHQRGVIHRDIKPGNLLREENSPRVLISDFGLARAIDDATVTISGMIAGTPQYMSPEQASGDDVGPESDLFSLGGVLYSMLTGRPPFMADSPIAVLRKVIDTTPKPASVRIESLPPWVDQLIDRFLEKDPTLRIASAGEAAKLLRRAEAHVRNPSANDLPSELRQPRNEAKILTWICVLLSGVALCIGGASLMNSSPPAKRATTGPATELGESLPPPINSDAPAIHRVIPVLPPSGPPIENDTDLSWQWNEFATEVQRIRQAINSMDDDGQR